MRIVTSSLITKVHTPPVHCVRDAQSRPFRCKRLSVASFPLHARVGHDGGDLEKSVQTAGDRVRDRELHPKSWTSFWAFMRYTEKKKLTATADHCLGHDGLIRVAARHGVDVSSLRRWATIIDHMEHQGSRGRTPVCAIALNSSSRWCEECKRKACQTVRPQLELRQRYPLAGLLKVAGLARSTFYYQ